MAIDGKNSRRTGKVDATPLHLVSAFAVPVPAIPGQRATAEKSNEKTAIPQLLATLALEGCIVTSTRWETQASARSRLHPGSSRTTYTSWSPAVRDNQPILADAARDFFALFEAARGGRPIRRTEIAVRRMPWPTGNTLPVATPSLRGLPAAKPHEVADSEIPLPWIESARCRQGQDIHRAPLLPQAAWHRMPTGWRVSDSSALGHRERFALLVHGRRPSPTIRCGARSGHAAHNLAIPRHIHLDLIRLGPSPRKWTA